MADELNTEHSAAPADTTPKAPQAPAAQTTEAEESQAPAPDASPAPQEAGNDKRRYSWLALASVLLCVAAWIFATFDGYLTLAATIASIICGAFALGSRRAAIRNISITAIIASAVLMIVVGAFMFALAKLI